MKKNIVEALADPGLFGAQFPDLDTWKPWIAFHKALYGLEMDANELTIFRRHTGRHKPRDGGYQEACMIVGRQSGKTYSAATIAVYEAARAVLSGERGLYVPLIAQDMRGAQRALFGYVTEAVDRSPALCRIVTRKTATEIELDGRVTIGVYPCRPASVRGIRAACVLIDELAFFTATDGRPTDQEMLQAARPATATTNGRVVILSSPYAQAGALFELHRQHYGKEDSATLIWQASAPDMNPMLTNDYLQRMEHTDPEAYRAEVLGEFRAGISTFLDPDALAEVVATGIRERAPQDMIEYHGFVDAASGSGKDSFACGIAHKEGDQAILDCIRHWQPPFNPNGVIAEVADLLKSYRIGTARGDRYAPGFVAEGFRANGINYQPADKVTSDIYLELLPLVNSGSASLLDDPRLLRELRGLERRRGTAGRDKVDHRRGAHDDVAVAAAGALVTSRGRHTPKAVFSTYGADEQRQGYRMNESKPSRLFGSSGQPETETRTYRDSNGNFHHY